uniref:ORF61 n=1 Tax=Siberian sturgeon herpesvirus TaxID=577567 RepID=D3X9U7_9VIRU|nr:ORF61 [Siberian sturgeon herpesvirus]
MLSHLTSLPSISTVKNLEAQNILPEKIYLTGCTHRCSPHVLNCFEFNEILMLQDELTSYGACLGYFLNKITSENYFLYSPWLTEWGIVIVRDPLIEYAMRIFRAVNKYIAGIEGADTLSQLRIHINNMSQFTLEKPSIYQSDQLSEDTLIDIIHKVFYHIDKEEFIVSSDAFNKHQNQMYKTQKHKLNDVIQKFPLFFNFETPHVKLPFTFQDKDKNVLYIKFDKLYTPIKLDTINDWETMWTSVSELYAESIYYMLTQNNPHDTQQLQKYTQTKTGFIDTNQIIIKLFKQRDSIIRDLRFLCLIDGVSPCSFMGLVINIFL